LGRTCDLDRFGVGELAERAGNNSRPGAGVAVIAVTPRYFAFAARSLGDQPIEVLAMTSATAGACTAVDVVADLWRTNG
jgi:hypothetical protein